MLAIQSKEISGVEDIAPILNASILVNDVIVIDGPTSTKTYKKKILVNNIQFLILITVFFFFIQNKKNTEVDTNTVLINVRQNNCFFFFR